MPRSIGSHEDARIGRRGEHQRVGHRGRTCPNRRALSSTSRRRAGSGRGRLELSRQLLQLIAEASKLPDRELRLAEDLLGHLGGLALEALALRSEEDLDDTFIDSATTAL